MALFHSPSIVRSGMIFNIDAANIKSYNYSENLFLYSSNLNSGYFTYTASSSTATVATMAPDGSNTAFKLVGGSGQTGRKSIYQGISVNSGSQYTFSVYMKAAEFTSTTMWFDSANITPSAYYGAGALINLTNGGLGGSGSAQTTVTSVGNGWYRCQVVASPTVSDTMNFQISQGDANGAGTPAGDGTSGVYIWGPQLQRSPWIEKYTPTAGVTTTASYTMVDLSGRSTNGNLNTMNPANFPVYSSTSSGAIMFAGTDTYIRTASLGTMTQYTFSFWARRDAESRMAVSTGNGQYYWYGDNSWRWGHGPVGGEHYYTKSFAIPLGTWGYYAATYDGLTVSVYRQGQLQTSASTSSAIVDLTSGLTIGWWGNNNYAWLGPISMVTIYNRALSASEISQNFNAYRDRYGI